MKAKEKGGGFTWRRLSHQPVANGGVGVPAVPAVLVAAPPLFFPFPFSLFFSSFFLFGSSFFLFFFPVLSPLPSALSLLFSSVLSLLFFQPLFSRALPCIYRKNRGERGRGRPLCSRPKNCPRNTSPPSSPTRGKLRASGVGRRLFKRELAVENIGRKNLFPPLLRASRGKRKVTVPFKTAPFWSLVFFLTVHETTPFLTKHAVSFKRKGRQNVSESKLVFNLYFVQSSPQLQF